jgi:hypothetical protein
MLSRRIMALAALAIGVSVASAKDGRDFAGFYSLTNPIADGDRVHVTVTLQLFNYSGSDLHDVAVAIRSTPPEPVVHGTYSAIGEWRDGTDVKFVMHLTVPRGEYKLWGGRTQPGVYILHRDEEGRAREHAAQVSRRPGIPLEDVQADR